MLSASRSRTSSATQTPQPHPDPLAADKNGVGVGVENGVGVGVGHGRANANATANATATANAKENLPLRRSSLGFLRRSRSTEIKPLSKKQQALAREQEMEKHRRELAAIPRSPPRLPDLYHGQKPVSLPFGGAAHPDALAVLSSRAGESPESPESPPDRASMEPARASLAVSGAPAPPRPASGAGIDPYARTESMTHRGRYSYASSAVSTINTPRRLRRRKDPTPFNILIIGAQSSGKTSFLEFLKRSLALPPQKRSNRPQELVEDIFAPQHTRKGTFESHYLETEIDGERVGLTLWDSEGLEKNVVDLQLREMSSFVESKFEETLTEEMKVVRAPGVQDTHIHCAFLLLDPLRLERSIAASQTAAANGYGRATNAKDLPASRHTGALDADLDLQVLRALQGKTTVVPVISKADTITTAHMTHLKKTVWESLRKANLDPLEALGLDDLDPESPTTHDPNRIDEGDEDEHSDDQDADDESRAEDQDVTSSPHAKRGPSGSVRRHQEPDPNETPYFPLSIISPDLYEPSVAGRRFPWGFADPMDVQHCDFVKLKDAVFGEWRGELREASRELWYEGWRTSRLKHLEKR